MSSPSLARFFKSPHRDRANPTSSAEGSSSLGSPHSGSHQESNDLARQRGRKRRLSGAALSTILPSLGNLSEKVLSELTLGEVLPIFRELVEYACESLQDNQDEVLEKVNALSNKVQSLDEKVMPLISFDTNVPARKKLQDHLTKLVHSFSLFPSDDQVKNAVFELFPNHNQELVHQGAMRLVVSHTASVRGNLKKKVQGLLYLRDQEAIYNGFLKFTHQAPAENLKNRFIVFLALLVNETVTGALADEGVFWRQVETMLKEVDNDSEVVPFCQQQLDRQLQSVKDKSKGKAKAKAKEKFPEEEHGGSEEGEEEAEESSS